MFTAALIIIVKKWKQPKFSSTSEKIAVHATTQMNLPGMTLSERSQTQKATHYMSLFI